MKRILLILVIMLVGCGADHSHTGKITANGEELVFGNPGNQEEVLVELEEPDVGEYYVCNSECAGCLYSTKEEKEQNCACLDREVCEWVKFKHEELLDNHKGEIKVNLSYGSVWINKYFFYSDIPDRYQKKRDEIENEDVKFNEQSNWYLLGNISAVYPPYVDNIVGDWKCEDGKELRSDGYCHDIKDKCLTVNDIDKIAEAVVEAINKDKSVVWVSGDLETNIPRQDYFVGYDFGPTNEEEDVEN